MAIVDIPVTELLEESNPKINQNFSELDTRTGAVEDRFDGSGVLLPANLPSLARITPSVVASEAAMLALDAQSGDVAVRTDLDPDRSFMLGGDGNPATLASWIPITFATSGAGTGHTVADEGTPVAARGTLNFTGAGVTVTDDGANDQTDVSIAGGGGSSLATGAFRAYRTTGLNINATWNLDFAFNVEGLDVSGWYSNTTYRYTPQAAGIYRVGARVTTTATSTDQGTFIVAIAKNGAEYAQHTIRESGTGAQACAVETVVDMNGTTDYLSVFVYRNNQASAAGTAKETHFYGHYLGTTA